ncbi:hypothetical protein [Paenibacillus daejeonensis]|uniref:hypothetical protein n=1 Tax=Paenibacillus daejeonensis TaxID=135193 RepID=UPI000364454C|nr:hypothetical protein [Paenibacillus daejeonensis]
MTNNEQMDVEFNALLYLTEDHIILDADDTLLSLLGYDHKGLCGCQFESILTPASSLFIVLHFQPLMKMQGSVRQMSLILKTANGQDIPVFLHADRQVREGQVMYLCRIKRR